MDALLHVLDLGDRLIDSLDAGDLDGATATLREREAMIASLLDAPPATTPAQAERARQQEARLGVALHAAQERLRTTAGGVRQTATAAARYSLAPAAARLDTAPRGV
ncbi:MAG: hypothetical protein AAF845_01740 [Bacteroidota bacterium]